jgi:maleate cis-trans isomerase
MPKIGSISPSVIQLPSDLNEVLPADVTAIVATLNNRNGKPGEEERSNAAIPGAVHVLADEGAKAIVVMGIPNAARRGYTTEQALFGALARERGVPIVSSLTATALACLHLGVRHALLVTQYDEPSNERIVTFCRDAGLTVDAAVGLGCRNADEVNAKTAADYDALARATLPRYPQCDAVVIFARGNMLGIARALEDEKNIPVIEQTQATAWWSLAQIGHPTTSGLGKLLSSGAAPTAVTA